jgi:cardiolipin synthase
MNLLNFGSVPNLITLVRLLLVPLIVAMITAERWNLVFGLFVVAGLSDALDGWIAKTFDLKTDLGAYLDPLADKALLVSIYVALAIVAAVPPWLTILVVSRDVMIIGAFMVAWLLGKPIAVRPILVSKLNTGAQLGFAAAVLAIKAFDVPVGTWFDLGVYVVATLTFVSLAAYFAQWVRHMSL